MIQGILFSSVQEGVHVCIQIESAYTSGITESILHILDDVAWDWVNKKLYWADPCTDLIEVYDPATGDRRVLFSSINSYGIVVDPITR